MNNNEPVALRKLEQVADRSYSSLHDLMTARHGCLTGGSSLIGLLLQEDADNVSR